MAKTGVWVAAYTSVSIINVALIGLVGGAVWFLGSAWPMLGLIFIQGLRAHSVSAECPKCQHRFKAVSKDDDE